MRIMRIMKSKMKKNKARSKSISKRKPRKNRKVSKKVLIQRSTDTAIEMCNRLIKNKQLREQNILFIKAANGKRIRNTSGV